MVGVIMDTAMIDLPAIADHETAETIGYDYVRYDAATGAGGNARTNARTEEISDRTVLDGAIVCRRVQDNAVAIAWDAPELEPI